MAVVEREAAQEAGAERARLERTGLKIDGADIAGPGVLNSGTGYIGTVDLQSGAFEPRAFCPGFLRGLAFHNGHAIVGLSLPRDGTFSGLALDTELKKRDADPWCGVQVINLASGD